ncbi:MAG: hypothetical protein ABUK01_00055 [Leptospirales bacterium]
MSGNHEGSDGGHQRSETITLNSFEANLASVCVAIVFGSIGGNIGTLLTGLLPFWGLITLILALGFIFPWIVCKYLFKTAHEWYGPASWQHRMYDGIGIVAAVAAYYI